MSSRATTPLPLRPIVATILAFGFVLTGAAALVVENRAQSAVATTLDTDADAIAEAVSSKLQAEVAAYNQLWDVTDDGWPSSEVWSAAFGALGGDLPGDTAAALVVAVPAENFAGFVAAEKDVTPGFEPFLVNETPDARGHAFYMRSDAPGQPLGIDLSFSGPLIWDLLEGAGDGRLVPGDFRQAMSNSALDSLQVVSQNTLTGPDGVVYNAWTLGQIDMPQIVAEAIAGAAASGVAVNLQLSMDGRTFGAAELSADQVREPVAATSRDFGERGLDVELSFRADRSLMQGLSRTATLLIGGLITLVTAIFAAALLLFRTLLDRASTSEQRALSDELTGLPNRRWLMNHLTSEWDATDKTLTLFFCDLDRFKVVNDSLGHTAGDALLRAFADRLAEPLGTGERLVRFGGDEFIVCAEIRPEDVERRTEEVAQAILAAGRDPFLVHESEFITTISVGIAHRSPGDDTTPEDLIREADTALSQAKRGGRDHRVIFDQHLRNETRGRLALESALRQALKTGDLELHYQPLVEANGDLVSFEALVRWRRAEELVRPDTFLPVLAELNLMPQLGEVVLAQALRQMKTWIDDLGGTRRFTMHVNADPQELSDLRYPARVARALAKAGVPASVLVLEMTEEALPDTDGREQRVLEELAEMGVGIAIDDFGTGHSSLSRLLDVPGLTELKIDRSISVRARKSTAVRAVVNGVIAVARELDIAVIAEGVENADEHDALVALGVDVFQGWHHGRPAPAAEWAALIGRLRRSGPASPLHELDTPESPAGLPTSITSDLP